MTHLTLSVQDISVPSETRLALFVDELRYADYFSMLSAYAELGFLALEHEALGKTVDAAFFTACADIIETTLAERGLHL